MSWNFRITSERPKRAWPYLALAAIVYTDSLTAAAMPNGYPWAMVVFLVAVTLAKTAMAGFIMEYGFRVSMEEWRKKLKREDAADQAKFMHHMDQLNAESRERHRRYMADYNRLHGEGWKDGKHE